MALHSYNLASININTITNRTKLNALQTFLRDSEIDIAFLQEVENEQLLLPGYNVVCNVDHTRRGTAIALKEHVQYSNIEKSLDGRIIALRVQNTTLCNVYAPSGTALRAERERFYDNTLAFYLRNPTDHTIIAGDFNCVLRQCDATGHNPSPALLRTVQQLQLLDVWEKVCPNMPGHTYVTHNSSSRLDRMYVSQNLRCQLRTACVHVCSFSDHKALTARICLPYLGREAGRGFWSLRPHLLTAENIDEFRLRWQYWTRQRRNFRSWMQWWLSYAKPRIKSFFRWKSKEAFNDFHRVYQRLYTELRQAYDGFYMNPGMIVTINRVKAQMLTLQRNFTETFMRINESHVAGEPISTFQLGDRRRKRTIITSLRDDNNDLIEESEAIETHMLGFYRALYAAGTTEREVPNEFICPRVIPENDPVSECCMSEITVADVFTAIKTSSPNKSPGGDSIPREFYLRTFDIIWREITLVMNEALASNFPADFVDGVIVLVKKKGNDQTAHSYRPISLLNCDYKIFSRILKLRLENVMRTHNIISGSQKCSNFGRNIFQATLALKDRIARLKKCKQRGLLASFDLRHAFDLVDRSFLARNMCSIGFNPNFVRLLVQIGELSSSRLLINGHLSESFPIERSVRQGDPLSMHLFVLYLHPLIKRLEEIGGPDLVVAYADDVSVISTCGDRLERMREAFHRFERISGARLSLEKSSSISVGYTDEVPLTVPWLRNENTVRILGVIFSNSIRLMNKLNWDDLVGKFARLVYLHATRSLTLHQKVTLLNTFITSKIWYLASTLSPSAVHTAKLTATMGSFLWRGIPARVPMHQLARSKENGGLKLHLPAFKCPALLLNRHMRDIDSLPFYKSFLTQDNPNPPADCPCLKILLSNIPLLPPLVRDNPSADNIHAFYIEQTEEPKICREHPAHNWRQIWANIAMRQLPSSQRSTLFLLVNAKLVHRRLMFRTNRADSDVCLHCNGATETLEHKLSGCVRVTAAWRILQQKISLLLNGWRSLTIGELLRPQLNGISKGKKVRILQMFTQYVLFIMQCNDVIDLGALEFEIQLV